MTTNSYAIGWQPLQVDISLKRLRIIRCSYSKLTIAWPFVLQCQTPKSSLILPWTISPYSITNQPEYKGVSILYIDNRLYSHGSHFGTKARLGWLRAPTLTFWILYKLAMLSSSYAEPLEPHRKSKMATAEESICDAAHQKGGLYRWSQFWVFYLMY